MSAACKPMLFSAPMVRALLEGRKTQTRRIVKPQPEAHLDPHSVVQAFDAGFVDVKPPHPVGSEIWVRETWALASVDGYRALVARAERMPQGKTLQQTDGGLDEVWLNDENKDKAEKLIGLERWRPSIFMPRWASRITLKVTDVRVQRLQDISEEDAIAEGILWPPQIQTPVTTAKSLYFHLWETINGHLSVAANPWVWAYTFEVKR